MSFLHEKPATLLEVRDRMRARNDAHAAAEGLSANLRPGPVPVRELASTIARDNAARLARSEHEQMRDAARAEILLACASLRPELERARSAGGPELAGFLEAVSLFHGAILEYLTAESNAPNRTDPSSALEAMREAIRSLDKAGGR
jgi:hypothetical protein